MASEDDWDPSEDSDDFDIEEESAEDSGVDDDEEDFEMSPAKKTKAVPKKSPAKTKAAPKKSKPEPKKTTPIKRKVPADGGTPSSTPSKKPKSAAEPKASAAAAAAAKKATAAPAASKASGSGKVKALSGKAAEDLVLKYVTDGNRPYSHTLLSDNLHGAVSKPLAVKILDKLAESGQLQAKVWGKTKLWWPNQEQYAESSSSEVAQQLEAELREAQTQLAAVRKEVGALSSEVAELAKQPSDAQADEKIAALEKEWEEKHARLKNLSESQGLMTKDQVNKVTEQFKTYFKHWKQRRAATAEILGLLLEQMEKKAEKKFIEKQGLETEEDQGVNFKEYLEEFRKMG